MIYALGDRVPDIADDVFIAPSASIIGSVTLEPEVSVWFGAVIRGDVERILVKTRANIQDGAVLHADEGVPLSVGRGVTLGHLAMVHGCTIGDHSLIGIHSTILNHANIGHHCVIGANALITEGMKIPDGSLAVGAPAKVIKTLTPEQFEQLEKSAAHYVDNRARFLRELTQL